MTQEIMSARKHRILVVVALAGVALSCVLAWKNLAMQGRIETLEASLKEREGELQSARTPSRVAEEAQVQYTENPADGNGEKVASEPAPSPRGLPGAGCGRPL